MLFFYYLEIDYRETGYWENYKCALHHNVDAFASDDKGFDYENDKRKLSTTSVWRYIHWTFFNNYTRYLKLLKHFIRCE